MLHRNLKQGLSDIYRAAILSEQTETQHQQAQRDNVKLRTRIVRRKK